MSDFFEEAAKKDNHRRIRRRLGYSVLALTFGSLAGFLVFAKFRGLEVLLGIGWLSSAGVLFGALFGIGLFLTPLIMSNEDFDIISIRNRSEPLAVPTRPKPLTWRFLLKAAVGSSLGAVGLYAFVQPQMTQEMAFGIWQIMFLISIVWDMGDWLIRNGIWLWKRRKQVP